MAEENTSKIKEIENCFDTNPQETNLSEEGSVRTVIVKDVRNVEDAISLALKGQEEFVSKTNEVPKPLSRSLRRYSTGALGKVEVQSRYRGNHHVPSTHDLCKHGKSHDHGDDAVKPWKVVRRTSVGGSVGVKAEAASGSRRTSLGSLSRQIPPGAKPESCVDAKRDPLSVKKKPCVSVNSETSSVKEESKLARSVDGSSVRSRKNIGTESTQSGGSAVFKKVLGLGSEKSSSNVYSPKSKEKAKAAQTISGEDVKEKTVRVVEASVVKGGQSEKLKASSSSEKKTMRSRLKILATPTKRGSAYHTPTKKVPGTALTNKKKESGDAELVAKKIRPTKKTGVKVTTLAKQLNSKKGNTLEPKLEELETQTEGWKKKKRKNLKGVDETRSVSCEGSKREKVVLRRRKVEGKKKMMTLFNGVIEETVNKLIKVRKTKVKALIGAFETVISLQDTKTPQCKAATSESQVNPLGSKQ